MSAATDNTEVITKVLELLLLTTTLQHHSVFASVIISPSNKLQTRSAKSNMLQLLRLFVNEVHLEIPRRSQLLLVSRAGAMIRDSHNMAGCMNVT